jgi:hypothetical protein
MRRGPLKVPIRSLQGGSVSLWRRSYSLSIPEWDALA